MQTPVFRNKFVLRNLTFNEKKQFAFGILLEENPRMCFIPHWIVRQAPLHQTDLGATFDCLFIEQETAKEPLIVAILKDGDLKPSVEIGCYNGKFDTRQVATIANIDSARKILKLKGEVHA